MTIASDPRPTFGSGGAEPYARALRREGLLQLVRSPGSTRERGGRPGDAARGTAQAAFDVARWTADADAADLTTIDDARSVLDIGCGPARMVRAAVDRGLTVLGLDVSPTAVAMAREAGLPVAGGSVFDPLPREGQWNLALLLDGNVGIGGDPTALLTRCAEILTATGSIVVETAPEASLDDSYEAHVVDDQGHASATFPWAEVGREALHRHAQRSGLRVAQTWSVDGRTFCRLRAR